MGGIGKGARGLLNLNLKGGMMDGKASAALARMLEGGGCPRLEELDLGRSPVLDRGIMELARAMEGGAPCRDTLRRLYFQRCDITATGMKRLVDALEKGSVPHLEHLYLNGNEDFLDVGGEEVARLMSLPKALTSLQELVLTDVGIGDPSAVAIFQSLRERNPCPHLKKLDVGCNFYGAEGLSALVQAIEAGVLQQLRELGVALVSMDDKGFKSLVKAIVAQQPNPGCPHLEELDVNQNPIGKDGITYLAEVIKQDGAMQHLRELDMSYLEWDEDGLSSFFGALDSSTRVLPRLARLHMTWEDDDEDLLKELVDGVNAKRREDRSCNMIMVVAARG